MNKPLLVRKLGVDMLLVLCVSAMGPYAGAVSNDMDNASITIHDNVLSGRVYGAQLRTVLYLLSENAHVSVDYPSNMGELRLWASFDDLTLREAVMRLLKGHNYVLLKTNEECINAGKDNAPIAYLKILEADNSPPQEKGDRMVLDMSPESAPSPGPDLNLVYRGNPGLYDPDPKIRSTSIQELVHSDADAALPFVLASINDPDVNMQATSLALIEEHGWLDNVPVDMIERLALQGQDTEVRIKSLQLLSKNYANSAIAREALELASGDQEPAVRAMAVELLAGLGEVREIQNVSTK